MNNLAITTHIDVRMPRDLAKRVTAAASEHKCNRSEFVRRLIVAALDGPVMLPPDVPAKRPKREICDTPERDVFDLFQRGHTINQIAAMKRIPYAHVATMIGRAVDARNGGGA